MFKPSVEIPILLCFFCFMITGPVFTNLIVYRTCYILLHYNKSECALLGNTNNNVTDELEKLVEPQANVINMVKSLMESIFTVIACIFVGPWSDRFGRKPILLYCLTGFSVSSLLLSIFSFLSTLSPWYVLFSSIPIMLSGGGAVFLTVVFSYITDVTNNQTRGIRMSIFEGVIAGGSLLGNISSSYIFYATNYTSVFAIATGCYILCILYVVFLVPESVENRETQGMVKAFFEISNVIEMIKTVTKKREKFKRAIILLTLAALTLYIFIIMGSGLTFLYLREKFHWTLTKYTLYDSASSVVWILGAVLGTYLLHKLLEVPESILALMGFMSMANGSIIMGLAKTDMLIYASAVLKCLGGIISPMLRSLVSKLVPPEEIGKIFSVIMASEFLFGLGASPLYTAIYNSTINTDPGIYNYVSAGIYTVDIILVLIIVALQLYSPPQLIYGKLNEDITEENEGELYVN